MGWGIAVIVLVSVVSIALAVSICDEKGLKESGVIRGQGRD